MANFLDPTVEFNRQVSEFFLKAWVQGIEDCYKIARTVGRQYQLHGPQAMWNEPYARRTLIESRTLDIVSKFEGIVPVQAYAGKDSSPYVVLKIGSIVLTESMVDIRCQLPREATHRRANAQGNRHLYSDYEDALPEGTPIYAILAHVPHWQLAAPKYIDVIFPNATYNGIEGKPIDLLTPFTGNIAIGEEKVVEPTPTLKKDRQQRKAQ